MHEYRIATSGAVFRTSDGRRLVVAKGSIAHKDNPIVSAVPFIWSEIAVQYPAPKQEAKSEPVKRGPGRPRKA